MVTDSDTSYGNYSDKGGNDNDDDERADGTNNSSSITLLIRDNENFWWGKLFKTIVSYQYQSRITERLNSPLPLVVRPKTNEDRDAHNAAWKAPPQHASQRFISQFQSIPIYLQGR